MVNLRVRTIPIPGASDLSIAFLVLDLNGTLSERGELIEGVADRLKLLAADVDIHLLTADTLGTAQALATELPVTVTTISRGADKADFVRRLGRERTVAIGNGRNDEAMLRQSALGIAVVGSEGAASVTLLAADLVCRSILEALDLLLDQRLIAATLRP